MFIEDGWFEIGDFGFLWNGCLIIIGCMKDVIIINGINYYSYVIEFVVEELFEIEIFYIVVCVVCLG